MSKPLTVDDVRRLRLKGAEMYADQADRRIEELEAEVARLREALVEERARRLYETGEYFEQPWQEMDTYPQDLYRADARAALLAEGLLP